MLHRGLVQGAAIISRRSDWRTTLTLGLAIAIVAGGVLLRIHNLNQDGLNSDEAVYAGQAAGLAGFTTYRNLFGLFRAHPLLVQLIVSVVFRVTGVSGLAAREVCVGFGVALIVVVGLTALVLWGRVGALMGMLLVAVSPYAITISQQMLLDGPEAFFVACCILCMCLYLKRRRPEYFWLAAFNAGLAFLSKETAILLLPAALLLFVVAPETLPRVRDGVIGAVVYVMLLVAYPLAELGAGKVSTGADYLTWQILRPANHDFLFYLATLGAIGWATTALALVGIGVALKRRQRIDFLLVCFTLVIFGFLELWPTKGYEYLMPLIAPFVLLAVSGAMWLGVRFESPVQAQVRRIRRIHLQPRTPWLPAGLAAIAAASILLTADPIVSAASGAASAIATDSGQPTPALVPSLAGSGGLLAGRPTGRWVLEHTLQDSVFLTVGPTFANVLEFYGHRRALALSVSPDPLHRNPSYAPVINADALIRSGAVQYLVYDAYSAARSTHFASRILDLAKKFKGVLVYHYDSASPGHHHLALVLIYQVQP